MRPVCYFGREAGRKIVESMSAYPAARAVAKRVLDRMQQHGAGSTQPRNPEAIAPLPAVEVIEAMVEAAFWASLRREEGRTPLLSLAFVSASHVPDALVLGRPVKLSPEPLTRLAPAVERPGIHLGVWEEQGELSVWGATRALPQRCFVLEVIAPGFLILKQSPAEAAGKFVNIAVVQGDEIKIVGQATPPDSPPLLKSLFEFEAQYSGTPSVNVPIQLAVSMRAHGHGGVLLVVPANTNLWPESIARPLLYSVSPPSRVLTDLMSADEDMRATRPWQDALSRAVDAVAGLTAVDGATILNDRYELLAFGAKIVRRPGSPLVSRMVMTEPVEDSKPEEIEPAQLGGTRHLSAAQFAWDQRDAVALVASQDGRFTVLAWSGREQVVRAYRMETLLF
jgi:hypothetical protein